MTRFIPAFLQRRLLRFIVSKIDLIDADAFDLDSLDLTWGVWELKDVPLRIDKIRDRIPLPPGIELDQAHVRQIKIILPGDIYSANLAIEVSGVEIQIAIHEPAKDEHHGSSQAPTSETGIDRGGRGNTRGYDTSPRSQDAHGRFDGLLPTSEDIAQSFLQAEPDKEIQELETAVASQSQELHRSSAFESEGSSSGELGVGAAASLPTFMTDMVKGLLDRFQLHVTNIYFKIVFNWPKRNPVGQEENSSTDPVQLIVQIAEVRLGAVDSTLGPEEPRFGKRRFTLRDAKVRLAGEPEGSFRTSTASGLSSPIPSRSSAFHSSGASDARSDASDWSHSPKVSRATPWEPSNTQDHLRLASSLSQSVGEHGSQPGSDDDSDNVASILAERGKIRRQSGASKSSLLGSEYFTRSTFQDDDPDELSESKLFTHDEAESMYLSAMSSNTPTAGPSLAIPGAWSVYEPPAQTIETKNQPPLSSDLQPIGEEGPPATAPFESSSEIPVMYSEVRSEEPSDDGRNTPKPEVSLGHEEKSSLPCNQPMFLNTTIVRDIVVLNGFSCWLPSLFDRPLAPDDPISATSEGDSSRGPSVRFSAPAPESPLDASYTSNTASIYHTPQPATANAEQASIEVEVSSIRVDIDMHVAKLMLSILQTLSPTSKSPESPAANKDRTSFPPMRVVVPILEVNFLEQVPGSAVTGGVQSETLPLNNERDLLLGVIVKDISFYTTSKNQQTESRLKVAHFEIVHGNGTIMSFEEHTVSPNTRTVAITSNPVISVIIVSTNSLMHVDIKTSPVRFIVDIRAIEDVFNRAGGLSSLLEIGGSIASMSTVKGGLPKAKPPANKLARGVLFQPNVSPKAQSKGPAMKVNAKIARAALDLVGSECTLKLSTSSLKMVQRAEGIGLQVDNVELSGPFSNTIIDSSPLKIHLSNIRLEYLDAPKEIDIDRLLRLITPSKDKYDEDDDIMLDTLMRQRMKGAVLRLTLGSVKASVERLGEMKRLERLSADLSRLSGVTKYLPEDDRPGILILLLVRDASLEARVNDKVGTLQGSFTSIEVAYINLPSLIALQVTSLSATRNGDEELIIPAVASFRDDLPMIMCRFIPGEMEPTVKMKFSNTLVEYRVPTLVALLGLGEDVTEEDLAIGLAASFADLRAMDLRQTPGISSPSLSSDSGVPEPELKGIRIDIGMRDLVVGLNPESSSSKVLICLTTARVRAEAPKEANITVNFSVKKASLLVIDNIQTLDAPVAARDACGSFISAGYVAVGDISSASAKVKTSRNPESKQSSVDIELRDDLFILETCADSTQTLIGLLDGLKPPAPVSKIAKYRTEIVPLQDMLASFSGDAFVSEQGPQAGLRTEPEIDTTQSFEEGANEDLEYVSEFYEEPPIDESRGSLAESSGYHGLHGMEHSESDLESSTHTEVVGGDDLEPSPEEMVASALNFQDDYFARNSQVGGSNHNRGIHDPVESRHQRYEEFPVKVRIRDVHFIWNLYDGYDWQRTRDTISQAVMDMEVKAATRRGRPSSGLSPESEDEEEPVIEDFLFNSIYIGIPARHDPNELASQINKGINDDVSETGSYATSTTMTNSPSRQNQPGRPRPKRLKLARSKHHKMTFEISGLSADVLVFPPNSGETQSLIDVRVKDLTIFDHVPTSTWLKFATYMQDAGERETGASMIHLEILNVKPVPDLAATEMILKVTILPLRLHVDQDALDFMTRFFEFKDERASASTTPSNPPFLQRAEINPVHIKLDFKPKRVDYGGLRSGRTTEFMNFFILDEADMVLRRVILYGVSGFDRLGIMLNNIWTPDVKRNQLPGVLAGLAPIRSIVNVGGGVKDLVVLPVREYRKDGRLVRSIQKGAVSFAKTTTSELVKLGAKLALGTQTVLQNTETLLGQSEQPSSRQPPADILGSDDEDQPNIKKQISLYADQPIGVVQGLRGAYASLERDLLLARDAIVAVPGEVMESGSAGGAARAVLKKAPTVILRPAIGASKAVGQTLLGAGNTLDRENYRRAEEKYKRH